MGRFNLQASSIAIALGGLLTFTVMGSPGFSSPVSNTKSSAPNNLREGLPGRRISGGSRSPNPACTYHNWSDSQPVVALMPRSNQGKTLSTHPDFWFSLPAVVLNKSVEFRLFDSRGTLIHQAEFIAPTTAEITSISLPESAPPLQLEQNYRWTLSVVCNPDNRAEDLGVYGWVERVQLSEAVQLQLTAASMTEQIEIYEREGLWYDALTNLAALRRNPSMQITDQHWLSLIASINFPESIESQIATAPIGSALMPVSAEPKALEAREQTLVTH